MGLTAGFMITLVLGVVLRARAHEIEKKEGGSRGGGKKFTLRDAFLWGAVLSLFASGTLAVNTFVGTAIGAFTGLAIWIGWCIAIILILGIAKDIAADKEPDKVAPWFLFFLPSVTNNLGGTLGGWLQTMWGAYGDWAASAINQIFGA